jgi:hypothetical protein
VATFQGRLHVLIKGAIYYTERFDGYTAMYKLATLPVNLFVFFKRHSWLDTIDKPPQSSMPATLILGDIKNVDSQTAFVGLQSSRRQVRSDKSLARVLGIVFYLRLQYSLHFSQYLNFSLTDWFVQYFWRCGYDLKMATCQGQHLITEIQYF